MNGTVDMTKVRAFLAKKEELERDQDAAPSFESSGVRVRVAPNVAPLSRPPSPQAQARDMAATALHWQVFIYDTIGTHLGLELNAAMPPGALYAAIVGRIKEMNEEELEGITDFVRDRIKDLGKIVHGETDLPILRTNKPRPPRPNILPINIKKVADDTVAIFPVGGNIETLARVMDASLRWNHWRMVHECEVHRGTKDEDLRGWIVIRCDEFIHWSDKAVEEGEDSPLKQLFASFDIPLEGRLVTPKPRDFDPV